ncbi:MAG: putative bifunctional diguanylate cyclase/phosphodiesterase [Gammaproteobacteria bacterium]
MNRNDKGGSFDTDDQVQPDVTSQHEDSLQEPGGKDITRRENAVIAHETDVLNREKAVTAREDAAGLREKADNSRQDTADTLENTADLRESGIHKAESKQAAVDQHMSLLQQANANLVIATIEAHKMAEKIQLGKDQLAHMAHYDVLTDLPNRILLLDRLNKAIELAHRKGWQLALMFMDLDQFKHINDSLGHTVGDHLLQSVAKRLLGCARHSDTISRQGGDEFVKLLPFIASPEDATFCAQKMLTVLEPPHHIDGHDLHISMSIGISIYPNDGQDAETLIKCADTAMYYAKENGRNNYRFFEPVMNARAVQRHSIEASLRRALERQEFVLYFQPKVNLQSGEIIGVEALIRWQHPERGQLMPALFIPVAEDCGLILSIGRWVLREACIQAQAWKQAGLPPITVAVNTSALEFRSKGFLEDVRAILEETGLEPCYLELELTESVLMRNAETTHSMLHELSDLGVKLAIDDFGTGYSSLSYLRQFPIDTLKIDQSFVNQMLSSPDDASIVRAVISMGKSLNQRVIAEGVETPEQYAFLQAQNCDEGQGYYFGRPVAAEALGTLLQTGALFPLPA